MIIAVVLVAIVAILTARRLHRKLVRGQREPGLCIGSAYRFATRMVAAEVVVVVVVVMIAQQQLESSMSKSLSLLNIPGKQL